MKNVLFLAMMLVASTSFGGRYYQTEPLLGVERNPDQERIGFIWTHDEESGIRDHHYRKIHWIQGSARSYDRFGVQVVKPVSQKLTLFTKFGITRSVQTTEETRDLSGYDYEGSGSFWEINLWYRMGQ